MQYVAMTFWLLVIVFSALGVHRLWSSLVQPKIINTLLLPGTLVAQLGHILGLLVTGGTVNDTALVKDDDSGEPKTGSDPEPRVPLIGTIIIALLPLVGCAAAIYWVSRYFGTDIISRLEDAQGSSFDPLALPTSLAAFFNLLRESLSLVEKLVNVIWASDLTDWQTLLFLYLVICLTVRMAPLTGNLRGTLGAIFLAGVLAYLIDKFMQSPTGPLLSVWSLIVFCVAVLLFLLIISLLVTGVVHLVKTAMGQK